MTVIELCRQVPFTLSRAEDDGENDGLTLDGIATPFGRDLKVGEEPSEAAGWTFIDSWEGSFWERFTLGAMRKTLRENTPMMQYDHGRHPLIGSIPIGTYSLLEEVDEGLHVVGRLTDNWLVEPVRDAMVVDPRTGQSGIRGMSIRFYPVRDTWTDRDGKTVKSEELWELLWSPGERGPLRRSVTEAKLLEAGPVAWPAYSQTSVGVRASELAGTVLRDRQLRHEVQQSLALGQDGAQRGLPDDEDLRRDVARAVLFGCAPAGSARRRPTTVAGETGPELFLPSGGDIRPTPLRSTAPPTGHPADQDPEDRTTDAPPLEGHPSEQDGDPATDGRSTEDAPPAAGHPSPTEQQQRLHVARQLQMTLSGVRK